MQMAAQGIVNDGEVKYPAVVFQAGEWLIFGLLTIITCFLGIRIPLQRHRLGRALAVHSAGALLLCINWAFAGVALRRTLGMGWDVPVSRELQMWTLISLPWSFILYFAVLGSIQAFRYHHEARERELHATQLSAQLSDARLNALRMQLQPHFLFNTLNAITVLVRDRDTIKAERMLDQLSDMLRSVLQTDRPHLVPLREELQLLRQYLGIEQVRFSDRLRITYAIDAAALDALVPFLILQPLVENSVHHGLATVVGDAMLEISAHREGDFLELSIRDNGVGMQGDTEAGIGLQNTRERLSALYGGPASLQLRADPGGGTVAVIRLPWRDVSS